MGLGSFEQTKQQLQEEVNEAYGKWRTLAVEEALEAADIEPASLPKKLRYTAGTGVQIKWVDPRQASRRGREAEPYWAMGCGWLAVRVREITQLMQT